ncbi:DsbE family thiol:disulfide interchange protein [Aliikangiella marina]|uniref:DsbE family thiol:disulfide interchange protein n=1 Tax=Aliikangiella marina TaxID=1712262 RepID=A0A545T2I7_9GAMM|nr:DsbE family thiol:disulfide interchange protein [Aliikangiella marina]TQV71430.1 DsbE family thiol:disulfide interchange protein [Aliikangiella marina]
MSDKVNPLKGISVVLVFAGFMWFLWWSLSNTSSELPSQLIDRPVPQFSVSELLDENKQHTPDLFKEKISLLNVFASWCPACYDEHPYWDIYAQRDDLQIVGLNYKDKKDKALYFLETQGNPYEHILFDSSGRLGIEFGVYGAPETFLIGPNGKVRYRHVGVVTPAVFEEKFEPLISQIKQGF